MNTIQNDIVSINIPSRYEAQVSDFIVRLNISDNEEKVLDIEETQDIQEEKICQDDEHDNESSTDSVNTKEDFEVEMVCDHRINKDGIWQFQVYFKGYPNSSYWIDDSDCNCEKPIKSYFETLKGQIKTIYCLCRVSTKNQTGPLHVSLEAQERRLVLTAREKFGNSHLVRIKILKINASAYYGIPSVLQSIGDCASCGDAILTYRVDRLSRNIVKYLSFLEELNERGVLLFAQDENIWYKENKLDFIQGILDAHKESFIIGKRVKLALENRKLRGDEVFGKLPYGYKSQRDDKSKKVFKVENSDEQNVILRIKNELAKDYSYKDIANQLNIDGIKKRGRKWTAEMVKYTFKNNTPQHVTKSSDSEVLKLQAKNFQNALCANSQPPTKQQVLDNSRVMLAKFGMSLDDSKTETKGKGLRNKKKHDSLSIHTGMQSPIGRSLKKGKYAERIGKSSSVYLSAVMEYLTSQILDLAGSISVGNNKSCITSHDIQLAIRYDNELNKLLNGVTIDSGCVLSKQKVDLEDLSQYDELEEEQDEYKQENLQDEDQQDEEQQDEEQQDEDQQDEEQQDEDQQDEEQQDEDQQEEEQQDEEQQDEEQQDEEQQEEEQQDEEHMNL